MRSRQKVSRAGLALIEGFEGLRRTAARLPDGRWTIGYGHTRSAREGAVVTHEDAELLLLYDLAPVAEAVNELVFTPLTQNQFDALVALAFNVGVDRFRTSDVLKRVNEGRLTEAACELDLWRRAEVGGDPIVLDGLVRRRAAEKALFLTPPDGFAPTPSPLIRPSLDIAPELLPTSRPVEVDAPLEGAEAVVRRQLSAPPTEPAPPPPAEPAPTQVIETVVAVATVAFVAESEPASPAEAPAPAAPPPGMPSADALSYFTREPEPAAPETAAEAAPPSESVAEPASASAPAAAQPEPQPEPAPQSAPEPAPQSAPEPEPRSSVNVAEAVNAARLYGPMAAMALGRAAEAPAETPANEDQVAAPVAPEPPSFAPAEAPQPAAAEPVFAPPPPQPAPPSPQPAPPAPEPWTLTHPPEDWTPRVSEPEPAASAEAPGGDPTLFADGWAGGAATRVVRHETPQMRPQDQRGGAAPFILMALIGLTAFAGAVAAFLRGRTLGAGDDMAQYAWILAVIGAGCVATSVYFLLKRVGGVED
jgi:lysozyme